MSRMGQSIETDSSLVVAWGCGERGGEVMVKADWVTFRDEENVLKPIMVMAARSEDTKPTEFHTLHV